MTSSSSSSPEILGASSQDHFSYKHATHDEVLEDLSSRFILNLPDDELSSLERICFQVEQAHWFYEDFIREENPKLPSLPLKRFSAMLFHACPLLHQWSHDHEQAFNTFMQYKTRVPVCGAIMLNETMEKCLLVKGWKSSSGWGFPKGKINQVEPPASCAIREVLEETGYNLAGQIDPESVIEMTIKEQKISLYIVAGIPEDFPFKTKTRKEISKIEWFRLSDLPTWKRNKSGAGKFYLISPFIGPLKSFITERRPRVPRKVHQPKKEGLPHPQSSNELLESPSNDSTFDISPTSLSAENSEPQTRSQRCSESGATLALYEEGASTLDSTSVTIDPHFAHLLSSLAISASSRDREIPFLSPADISNSPQRISTSSLTAAPDQSTLPQRRETPVHTDNLYLDSMTPSGRSPVPMPHTPRPPISSSTVQPYTQPSRGSTTNSVSPFQSIASDVVLNASDSSSPQSLPPSALAADRSKHIALLEAVSAESARLMQAYKAASSSGVPFNVADNFKPSKPTLAMSRMPHQSIGVDASKLPRSESIAPTALVSRPTYQHQNITYTSDLSQPSRLEDISVSEDNMTPALFNTLQTRPRTSTSYHHTSTSNLRGGGSLNQNQLLALMNGPTPNVSRTYKIYNQPQNMNTAQSPFYTQVPQRPPIPLYPPYNAYQPPAPFIPISTTPLHTPTQISPPANNTLLSILNGSRNTPQVPNITPYPFTSIGRG